MPPGDEDNAVFKGFHHVDSDNENEDMQDED
jgi:hypothetical protein